MHYKALILYELDEKQVVLSLDYMCIEAEQEMQQHSLFCILQ